MDVLLPSQRPVGMAGDDPTRFDTVVRPDGASDLVRFSQRLRALSSLSTRLVVMTDHAPAFEEMVKGMWRVLGCDACALYLVAQDSQHLELRGVAGYEPGDGTRSISLDDVGRCTVQAFVEEYLVHVPDTASAHEAVALDSSLRSLLVFPIIAAQGPVGVFVFGNREPESFAPGDIDLSGMLVDQMTYMLENIRLVRQLRTSRDAVIRGMAILAEARDGDIGGHLDRICALSRRLAERLRDRASVPVSVDDEFVETITRAAALHDIGKVGIPDRILLKPGRLTDDEFVVMRTHSSLGARVLVDLMDTHGAFAMLEMGVAVAIGHHEYWDGNGYPNRVAGDAIPLAARIVALADVYDALTSRRVYKEAWDHDTAVAYMRKQAGQQFDPLLTEIFLDRDAELQEIRARYPD